MKRVIESGTTLEPATEVVAMDVSEFRPVLEEFVVQEGKTTRPQGVLAKIRGKAGRLNAVNANGRLYPVKVAEEALAAAKPMLERGRVFGQIDHPDTGDEAAKIAGTLRKAAVVYRDIRIVQDSEQPDRPVLEYSGVILDNEEGRHLKSLLDGGVDVAMSLRGGAKMAQEKVEGYSKPVTVVQAWRIRGIDPVVNPSFHEGHIATVEEEENEMKYEELTVEGLQQNAKAIYDKVCEQATAAARIAFDKEKADLVASHESAINLAKETSAKEARARMVLVVEGKVESDKLTELDKPVAAAVAERVKQASSGEVKAAIEAALAPVIATVESQKKQIVALEDTDKEAIRLRTRTQKTQDALGKAENAPFRVVLAAALEQAPTTQDFTDEFITQKVTEARRMWEQMGKPSGTGKPGPTGASQNPGTETNKDDKQQKRSPLQVLAGI